MGDTALAASKLTWEMESWSSIELRGREDFENRATAIKQGDFRSYHCEIHYIEIATGQRLFEEVMTPRPGARVLTNIDYSDGSRCASLYKLEEDGVVRTDQVSIRRHFGNEDTGWTRRPPPLQFFYLGLEPLPKALSRASDLGGGQLLGRECDRFLFRPSEGGQDRRHYVYWLDRQTAVPLRYEHYRDEKAFADAQPSTVWIAESLDEVGGHHLPLKSQTIGHDTRGPDLRVVTSVYKTVTDQVVFDREYPKAMFWPKITDAMTVFDYIGNKAQFPKARPAVKTAPADPIRADDSMGWGLSFSTVTFLLGAMVLASGLLLWWRRR